MRAISEKMKDVKGGDEMYRWTADHEVIPAEQVRLLKALRFQAR